MFRRHELPHVEFSTRLLFRTLTEQNMSFFLALREIVGLWSGWLVVGFMLGGVLGRRSFGGW